MWETSTWAAVRGGDRVRLGGVVADVVSAAPEVWVAAGRRTVAVRLSGRGDILRMPPTGPVEVWT